jgi:hypothetical protein
MFNRDRSPNYIASEVIEIQKKNLNSSEDDPLTSKQLSTLKAFEQLRLGLVDKVNRYISASKPLDHRKSLSSLRWHHRVLFWLGCLRYDPERDQKENLNDIFNELQGKGANRTQISHNQAVRKLHRSHKLFNNAKRKLAKDLDIVNIVKAVRKINNLTEIMLTQNQYSMLENQRCDMINSDSDCREYRQKSVKLIDGTDYQNLSPFDINLIRGTLYGKVSTEDDPSIVELIKEEYKLNSLVSGTVTNLDDSLELPLVQQFNLPSGLESDFSNSKVRLSTKSRGTL